MPASSFWTPRHGQFVLCGVGLPYSHLTKTGKAVGIYQAAEPILKIEDRSPVLDEAGLPLWNPPFVVPLDTHGRNVMVDRMNYADLKGYEVLIPGKGICHIGMGIEGEAVDKFFADNRTSELKLVLSVAESQMEGPLLDRGDMPPGRVCDSNWKPKP